MLAGYPFDVPKPGNPAPLTSYCVSVYHLPLLIAFSIATRTSFVWGGCMLLRAERLRSRDPDILQVRLSPLAATLLTFYGVYYVVVY